MDHISQRQLFLNHVAQTSELPLMGIDMNIVKAEGIYLTDVNGKVYTDLISGISVSNVGHCHPDVVNAIHEQSKKFMHLMVFGEFNQSPQVIYATNLSKLLPSSLNSVYYTTGGSEAIEGAMKLAKRATGRAEIISFKNAYHGSTQGALSLMGDEFFKEAFRPLLPGIRQLEYGALDQLEAITHQTAAVFIEPIQGEAGVRQADRSYFTTLCEKCNATGTLLVFDEIQTGFGRTGTLFAFEQLGTVPDILVVAKGMGGGLPIGAFIANKNTMNTLSHDPILGHINTFGGNAVAVAAANATLNIIVNEKLIHNAKRIEAICKQKLVHPLIKELRMAGALGAIEFGDQDLNFKVCRLLIEHGIITDWFLFCPTAIRLSPPLTITEEQLNSSIDTILKVLNGIV